MIERYTFPDIAKVWSEEEKFQKFLKIELWVCEALSKKGFIPREAYKRIKKKARISLERIKEIEKRTNHDIVAFVLNLSESLGKDARYIHYGLTSSDLLDTTLFSQIKEATDIILKDLNSLLEEVKRKALKYKETFCAGRTHGVHAEVYCFGLKFASFYEELERIKTLIKDSIRIVCCGKVSGSLGTFSYIDPDVEEYVCRQLKIDYARISTQIVSRDRISYYLSLLALLASVIERFATELRHLQRTEVREVEEPFYSGQKGSSSMPHKKNPIICERVCGLARLVRSYLFASFENINLWHERDISHSSVERVILPDSTILIVYILRKFLEVIRDLKVMPQNMLKNLRISKGLIFSQGFLSALMTKGISRPRAYELIQKISLACLEKNKDFLEELRKNPTIKKNLSEEEIEELARPQYYLKNVSRIYRRLGLG